MNNFYLISFIICFQLECWCILVNFWPFFSCYMRENIWVNVFISCHSGQHAMLNWSEWCWHDIASYHCTSPSWWSWNTGLFTSRAWVFVQILFPVYKWNSWTINRLIYLAAVLWRACVEAKTRIQSYTCQAWIYEN